MSRNDGSRDDDLEERARKQNSTLQNLIVAVGNLLATSHELLARLRGRMAKDQSSGPEGGAP